MLTPTRHDNHEREPVAKNIIECINLREKYLYKPQFVAICILGRPKLASLSDPSSRPHIHPRTHLSHHVALHAPRAPSPLQHRITPAACRSTPDHHNEILAAFNDKVEESPFSFTKPPRQLPADLRYRWNEASGTGEVCVVAGRICLGIRWVCWGQRRSSRPES